jgi:integrase
MLTEAVASLPPDQRAVFDEAGSVAALRAQYDGATIARAFMLAGAPTPDSRLNVEDGDLSYVRGDAFVFQKTKTPRKVIDAEPTPATISERDMVLAAHRAELEAFDRSIDLEAKTLHKLGEAVKPSTFGLRELVTALAPLTGARADTVATQNRLADRFIDFHGDLPLQELTIAHLRTFADAYRDFPASSLPLRGMRFKDVLKVAKAQNLPTINGETLRQHIGILKGLTACAPTQGYIQTDPWAQFILLTAKGKHSTTRTPKRLPFTGPQVATILADAATNAPTSIDRWAPLLAAYMGARREELGQMNGCDVLKEDGVWCIRITDYGEDQKVKNGASVRVLPLHQSVLDAGFVTFATDRPKTEFLFVNEASGVLKPMKPDKGGRVTPNFGKRFGNRLRDKLKITNPLLVFHSLRHRWEDCAEAVDMPQTHRRDLAGRTRKNDSQAAYGKGPRLSALKASIDQIDPLAD